MDLWSLIHAIAARMCPPPMLASYARSCSQPSHRHFVISEHNFWKLHMGHRRDSCLRRTRSVQYSVDITLSSTKYLLRLTSVHVQEVKQFSV